MKILEVLIDGNPILRQKSLEVLPHEIIDFEFKTLLKNMITTLNHHKAIGLAAPQVGILKRVIVVKAPKEEPFVMINPVLTAFSMEVKTYGEGCLSVPGLRGDVERPQTVRIEYLTKEGFLLEKEFEGIKAIIIQHELDHLNGILYTDRSKK